MRCFVGLSLSSTTHLLLDRAADAVLWGLLSALTSSCSFAEDFGPTLGSAFFGFA